jgi:hypothetical protein
MRVFAKTINPLLKVNPLIYNESLTKNSYYECKLSKIKYRHMVISSLCLLRIIK